MRRRSSSRCPIKPHQKPDIASLPTNQCARIDVARARKPLETILTNARIMRYLKLMTKSVKISRPDPDDIRQRLEDVLGGRGTTASLAKAVGLSQQQFRKIWTGKSGLPVWLIAITELLERVERKDWPVRWHEAIEHRSPLGVRECIGVRIASLREAIRKNRAKSGELTDDDWLELKSIVQIAQAVIDDEGWLGEWELSELDGAAKLVRIRRMPLLALQRVEKALLIAEMRDQDQMPKSHYENQTSRISE